MQTGAYTYAPSGSSTHIGWEADAHYQLTNALNVYGSIKGVEKAYLSNPADGISHDLYVPRFVPKAGVAYLHSVPKGTVAVNLDGFYYSGLPFYLGSPLILTHTKPHSRYGLRGSYYVGRTELTGFARLQP